MNNNGLDLNIENNINNDSQMESFVEATIL